MEKKMMKTLQGKRDKSEQHAQNLMHRKDDEDYNLR